MNSWERFDETSLPDKKAFYSSLNKEDITDIDYRHVKRVFQNFNKRNIGDYHGYMFRVIHYYLLMYLKALEINALQYMNLILLIFYLHLD